MKKLIEILRQATTELKVEYLKQTEVWAKESFQNIVKMVNEVDAQKEDLREIRSQRKISQGWINLPSWKKFIMKKGYFPNRYQDVSYEDMMTNFDKNIFYLDGEIAMYVVRKANSYTHDIIAIGEDVHVEKMMKYAENHYEGSLVKLAQRIIKKGLDISKMTMKSGFMNMNLEIFLTDGEKSVKAWTIIASGMVQRPHYRYLVK